MYQSIQVEIVENRLNTDRQQEQTILFSPTAQQQINALMKTAKIEPEIVQFQSLLPTTNIKELEERKQNRQTNFIAQNINKLNQESPGVSQRLQNKQSIIDEQKKLLMIKHQVRLDLFESDTFTDRINLSDFLPLFKQPYCYNQSFDAYLKQFKIGELYTKIKQQVDQIHHQAITFRMSTKDGLTRAQMLRKADMFNNTALQNFLILLKLSSGHSYIPLKTFKTGFNKQNQIIKDSLDINFLDKNLQNSPLYQIIPASDSVNYLIFDQDQFSILVKMAQDQLKSNLWEPYDIYLVAHKIFKVMVKANPKAKGVVDTYKRSRYEQLIYQKFEQKFIQSLTQAENVNQIDFSQFITFVSGLKSCQTIDSEVKEKVNQRQNGNISCIKIKNMKICYTGIIIKDEISDPISPQIVTNQLESSQSKQLNQTPNQVELIEPPIEEVNPIKLSKIENVSPIIEQKPESNAENKSTVNLDLQVPQQVSNGSENEEIPVQKAENIEIKTEKSIPESLPLMSELNNIPEIPLPEEDLLPPEYPQAPDLYQLQNNNNSIIEAIYNNDVSDQTDSTTNSESKKKRKRRVKEVSAE